MFNANKYYKSVITCFCIVLLFFRVSPSQAQYSLRPNIIHFSRQDYKASEKNWAVDTDSLGYVYFANHRGLLQFDGEEWKLYQLPGKSIIRSVQVATDGKIYTGSFEEFGYWERDDFGLLKYISLSDSIGNAFHNDEIWKILIDGDRVLFQSFSQIFSCKNDQIEVINSNGGLLFLMQIDDAIYVQRMVPDICRLDNQTLQPIISSVKLGDRNIRTAISLSDNITIFCTANQGLTLYENNRISYWDCDASRELKNADVNTSIRINDQYFAIGTLQKGIFICDNNGKVIRNINTSDELNSNTVYHLTTDNNGNLWAGLDNGIDFIKFDTPLKIYRDKETKTGVIYDVCTQNNNLYIGTNKGVFHKFIDNDLQESFRFSDLIPISKLKGQVWNLQLIDGLVFCGHANGTFLLQNGKAKQISKINGGYNLREITSNNERFLIQSTYTSLIIYKSTRNGSWEFSHQVKGFIEPGRFIEVDAFDNIWVSHVHKGVYKINLNDSLTEVDHIRYFGGENGFPSKHKIDVFKINNRILFTTGFGIYAYNSINDSIVPYSQVNSQLGSFANSRSIFRASKNLFWFIVDNNAGLFEATRDSLIFIKQLSFDLSNAQLVESFENISSYNREYSIACLTNGISIISNQADASNINSIQPDFTSIELFNQKNERTILPLHSDKPIKIHHNNNRIRFSFSAFQYQEGTVQYLTKLEGLESEWQSSSNSQRTFERLPSRNYTFSVKANSLNRNKSQSCEYSFTILAPWYKTQFAYITYIVVFISLVVLIRITIVLNLKKHKDQIQLEQQKKLQEEQLLANKQIVELQNDKLQQEVEFKSMRLAALTLNHIKRNEILLVIKEVIEKQMDELGNRFPKKNYNEIIKSIDKYISSDDDWSKFERNFDRSHENFFSKLKQKHPDLTPNDLKLAAFLRMNLTSKEIAPLLSISVRSVEMHRYRIRKKMNLSADTNLVEYLMEQ